MQPHRRGSDPHGLFRQEFLRAFLPLSRFVRPERVLHFQCSVFRNPGNTAVYPSAIGEIGIPVALIEPFFLGVFHQNGHAEPVEERQEQKKAVMKQKQNVGGCKQNAGIAGIADIAVHAVGTEDISPNVAVNTLFSRCGTGPEKDAEEEKKNSRRPKDGNQKRRGKGSLFQKAETDKKHGTQGGEEDGTAVIGSDAVDRQTGRFVFHDGSLLVETGRGKVRTGYLL